MGQLLDDIVRTMVGQVFWIGVLCVLAWINLLVILTNYLGVKTSLELMGTERMPLGMDELVGGFFQIFFDQATLAHCLALSLSVGLSISLFLLFHLAFELYGQYRVYRGYLIQGQDYAAQSLLEQLYRDGIILGLMASLVIFMAIFDLDLLKFRLMAGALSIEEPAEALAVIQVWDRQYPTHQHLLSWQIIGRSTWSYMAITLAAALGLEIARVRVRSTWTQLAHIVGQFQTVPPRPRVDNGGTPAPSSARAVVPPPTPADGAGPIPHRAVPSPPASPSIAVPTTPPSSTSTAASDPGDIREVIGGRKGERISKEAARRKPDLYVVDDETDSVFARPYWEQLAGKEFG